MYQPIAYLRVGMAAGFVCACGQPAMEPAPPRENLKVSIDTLPHTHIFKEVAVTFAVRNLDQCTNASDEKTCQGVAGLSATAFAQANGFTQEQALAPAKLEDKGNGLYVWNNIFPVFGANLFGLRFDKDSHAYSGLFTLDTSRGGSERYFCDVDKNGTMDHSYQIRWNTSTGPVVANGKPVTFSIELVRSFNAPPLNMAEPWKNSFEHLRPIELTGGLPTVKLMSGTGLTATELATLTPTYAGRGIYNVSRAFSEQELNGQPSRTFWLRITVTDDKNCVIDGTDETEYYFSVSK